MLPRTHHVRRYVPKISALGVVGLDPRVEEDEEGRVDDALESGILHLSKRWLTVNQNQRGWSGGEDNFWRIHVEAVGLDLSPLIRNRHCKQTIKRHLDRHPICRLFLQEFCQLLLLFRS